METAFLPAAIIWAALGIGLACLLTRLMGPEPGAEPPREGPPAGAPTTGD